MKAYLVNMHLLAPRSRSSAKVKVKYKGYISQKMAVSGAFMFHKHILFHWFSGHVIPADQLLPMAMSTGPTGLQLDFTYQNRSNPKLVSLGKKNLTHIHVTLSQTSP